MNVTIVVLESTTKQSAKGNKYTIVMCRLDERVQKLFSDVDLAEFVDKEVIVKLKLSPDQQLFCKASIAELVRS